MSTKSLQVLSQYSTNLTDKQWQVTEIILDPNHRKRKYSLRETMNAIMYLVKTVGPYVVNDELFYRVLVIICL